MNKPLNDVKKKCLITHCDCWIWLKGETRHGYASTTINNKNIRVHRFVYELVYGKIPKGKLICHKCDIRCCVNPKHIFCGTHKDNTQDMINKGRHGHGSADHHGINNPKAIFTEKQILTIRKLYKKYKRKRKSNGTFRHEKQWTYIKIANKFGVSKSAINHIINRRNW